MKNINENSPVYWSNHTSEEISERIKNGTTDVILPVGAIEQHGPHLDIDYDILIAERLALDLISERGIDALILPSISIGVSDHHLGFSGTLTLKSETFVKILTDIVSSLSLSGIKRMYIINGHGGNYSSIAEFRKMQHPISVISDDNFKFIFQVIKEFNIQYNESALGLHAGLFETSLALYSHPDSVNLNKLEVGLMPGSGVWDSESISTLISNKLKSRTENGVIGDPRGSSSVIGRQFYERLLDLYASLF